MRRTVLYTLLLLSVAVTLLVSEQVYALSLGDQKMDVTISNTYVTHYVWRGWDLFDNDHGWQPSVDVTFPELFLDTDLSINWWAAYPLHKGSVAATEMDYSVSLSRDFLDDWNISTGYTYFDFPKLNSAADVHEFWGSATWAFPLEWGTSISTTVWAGYDFPEDTAGPDDGWYYSWSLDAETPLPDWVIFQEDQTVTYGIVTWHTDGVAGVDTAYFYAYDFYLTTSYAIGEYITISPGIYMTLNNEDTINTEDEYYASIDVSFAF